jgi:polyhydroxyalkanoate synthesis regulator phasin
MAKRSRSADGLRGAVDRTFQATVGQAGVTRERAQELVDELATAAGRVRETIDDLRPPSGEDVRALSKRLDALERRLAEVEGAGRGRSAPRRAAKPSPAKRAPAKRPPAKRAPARGTSRPSGRSAKRG